MSHIRVYVNVSWHGYMFIRKFHIQIPRHGSCHPYVFQRMCHMNIHINISYHTYAWHDPSYARLELVPSHPGKFNGFICAFYMYAHTYMQTHMYVLICMSTHRNRNRNIHTHIDWHMCVCVCNVLMSRMHASSLVHSSPYTVESVSHTYGCVMSQMWGRHKCATWYGVATISRLLTIIGLFCKRAL